MDATDQDKKITPTESANEPLWTKNYIVACITSLFLFMSFDSMIPVLPLYMEVHEGISGVAGLPLASLTLGALLVRPVAGWAIDVHGRRKIFLGGLLLFLVPALLYILMLPAPLLIGLRFIQGLGFGFSNTALFTIASDIIPSKRMGEGMGYFTSTMSISTAISPALSSWVLYNSSYPTIFSIASTVIVLSIVTALFIRYPTFEQKVIKPKLINFSRSGLRPALVTLFIIINFSSVTSFLPVYASMQGVGVTGIFFTAMAFTSFVMRPFSGMLVDRKRDIGYALAVLIGTVAITGAILILAATSSSYHLVIGGIIYGVGFGFLQPTMLALCVRGLPPEERGAANATYWTGMDMGMFIGSITWGLVAASIGYRSMFYLTIIPVVLALFVYFYGQLNTIVPGEGKERKVSA
ncbi:MAG: MFS transporter [Bacillota bacterium]|nr:MFS transporter [Bacillota bacterium]